MVISDYAHLDREVRLVIELLAGALAARRPGINVLLYGTSGTGKTELTRVIAQALDVEAFMVHGHDDEGSPATHNERLSSLRLGQALLRTSRSFLVFDEMEDLFAKIRDKDASHEAMVSKEWFTSFLEENELPTIWITNSVRGVDRAYLRRFTYSIEFTELTAHRRAEVLEKCARDQAVLSSADVTELAQQYQSSPAQLVGCVAAAALAAGEPPHRELVERFLAPADKLVTGSAAPARAIFDPRSYRLDDVNCSEDLARMTDRLSSWRPSAGPGISLCLYGPPGTGKSEYVRYLASRMGRQLVYRHGSDIKSKWVGETERNLAEAFREAEAQDALLLFDEADSFLRDRERSVRNYEVTEVNEFLQQLERFRGVVACTTNLWDQLDQAALRRFVFKLEFRPLQLHQALGLFRATFSPWLGTDAEPSTHADLRVALRRHPQLTPGDLAAVRRKVVALSLEPTCADLLELLDLELHAKRPERGIGFPRA